MKNNDDKLYTIDEFTKEFAERWEIKENQYVLIENRGTQVEKLLNSYDTEIEAFKVRKKSKSKIDIIRANVKYVTIMGMTFLYDYEIIK